MVNVNLYSAIVTCTEHASS